VPRLVLDFPFSVFSRSCSIQIIASSAYCINENIPHQLNVVLAHQLDRIPLLSRSRLLIYPQIKLKIEGDKRSPCLKPFWV
jgi:hypothetical protein